MQTAFTDRIRKLDYNLALNSRVFTYETQTVDKFLNDFFELIPKSGELSYCRTSYTKCVLGDYCSVKYDVQQDFCNMCEREITPYNWSNDTSCQDFVLRECQPDLMSEFCSISKPLMRPSEESKCKTEFKKYCERNPKDSICFSYHDTSCQDFVLRECQPDLMSEFCSISKPLMRPSEESKCKTEFKKYCERNPKDSICFSYHDRCLHNYLACAKEKETSPFDDIFLKAKGDFVEFFQQSNDKLFLEVWWNTLTQWSSDYLLTEDPSQDFSYSTPFQTCLEDPFMFFQFESKLIVGDINAVNYEKGLIQHFQLKGGFSVGNWLSWNADRRFAIDWRIGLGASSKALSGILTPQESSELDAKAKKSGKAKESGKAKRMLNDLAILSFAAHTGMGSSESRGEGRDIESGFSNMVNMVASEAHIKIHPTHFKKCLVIKPQPNAFTAMYHKNGRPLAYNEEKVWPESFRGKELKKTALSRPGLMLCGTAKAAKSAHRNTFFTEKYYYISQVTNINDTAELLDPYNIRNRPFVIVLRGKKEFLKLFSLFRSVVEGKNEDGKPTSVNAAPGNLWKNYPKPVERLIGLNLARRAFRDTGFYPGIYTYESWHDERNVQEFMIQKKQNLVHSVFDWISESDFIQFDVPSTSDRKQILTK